MDLFIDINKIKDARLRGIFFGLLKRIEHIEQVLTSMVQQGKIDESTLIEYEGD